MRILGIDCGTAITGWAILESKGKTNAKIDLVNCGIIETNKLSPMEHRLENIGRSVVELIEEFQPDHLAIEAIYYFKNAKTVITVSQARGVVVYESCKAGLKCYNYTPLEIKQTITGYGRAEKSQMIFMINKIFKLNGKIKQDDAIDAVGVGYCHFLNKIVGGSDT